MKNTRLSLAYRENASVLHKKVGDVLLAPGGIFTTYKVYQEYPVNKINHNYLDASHRFDWVVLDLHLVVEIHGAQHYHPVDFGGEGNLKAIDRFKDIQYRDRKKEQAAIEAGFTYIAIPWGDVDKITDNYIWGLYQKYMNTLPLQKKEVLPDEYKQQILEKARAYRKEQYQRAKQRRASFGI